MIPLLNFFVWFISIIFLLTSLDKIIHWGQHIDAMERYSIIRMPYIKIFLFLFTLGELYVSITLIFNRATISNTVIFFVLIIIYTLAVAINLIRGNNSISCGCGSVLENDRLSVSLVYRNFMFMVVFGLLFHFRTLISANPISLDKYFVLGLLALCIILLYGVAKEYYETIFVFNRKLMKYQMEQEEEL